MATRASIDNCMEQCQSVLQSAQDEYEKSSLQEHYNGLEFVQSQSEIQQAIQVLEKLEDSSNDQQREQLHRMKHQLERLQNDMVLLGR